MTSKINVNTIADASGTSALSLSTSGIVTNSVPVGFSAIRSGSNQTGIPTGVYTLAEFTVGATGSFDTHNGWSNANHYYTVPAGCGGYWNIHGFVEFDVSPLDGYIALTKTATSGSSSITSTCMTRAAFTISSADASNPTFSYTFLASLSDGDIIKTEVYHNWGSDRSIMAPPAGTTTEGYVRCAMQGWRLF